MTGDSAAVAPDPGSADAPSTIGRVRGAPSFRRRITLLRWLGRLFRAGSFLTALGILGVLAGIGALLVTGSSKSFHRFGPAFLAAGPWDPTHDVYAALPAIAGTVFTSALALGLAVPVALGAAVFLAKLAPRWLREPLATVLDLSAAVPSVVFGFWAFVVVAPIMQHQVEPALARLSGGTGPFAGTPTGYDLLSASVVLAIMIVPTISAIARASLAAVPQIQSEAALSLGATRWDAVRMAVLRPALPGIAGGILLGLGRAAGETMVVAMMIGGTYQVPGSLFAKGQSIASLILNELSAAGGSERSALLELALVLLAITVLINVGARLLIRRIGRSPGERSRVGRRRTQALESLARFEGGRGQARTDGPRTPVSSFPASPTVLTQARRHARRRRWGERGALIFGMAAIVLAIAPLGGILFTAFVHGGPAIVRPTFYTGELPNGCPPRASGCALGGIGPAIQGTVILLGLASLFALPIGILAGIYLSEYGRNRFGRTVSFLTDVMAGIPSILLGLFVFVFLISYDPTIAYSALSGSAALGLLMVPIVARSTEDAIRAVPSQEREAALAIGFPRHRVTIRVVLSSARNAIAIGAMLALARAGGETAALVFTAFGSPYWFQGLGQPIAALPTLIYANGLSTAYPNLQADAWGATLVLLAIMLLLSLALRLAIRTRRGVPGAS